MQGIKDAFYLMLRGRIALGNPARTVVVRGVSRPGVVVLENELPSSVPGVFAPEVFCLEWTAAEAQERGPLPLWKLRCTLRYASDGTVNAGGMDRGRALAAMDAELVAALDTDPRRAPKTDGSFCFWADPEFGGARSEGERLERTAAVEVFGYE